MKRHLLPWLFIFVACDAYAQSIRRPPSSSEMCDACQTSCAISTQEVCDACIAKYCAVQVERIAPHGAPYDAWLGDYSLPRAIGVTMVYHEDLWNNPAPLRQMTNLDFAWDTWAHGFNVIKLWARQHPFCGGSGDWTWSTYYGVELTTPEHGCVGEDMMRFWREVPQEVIFYRPMWDNWSTDETLEDGARLTHMQGDFYAIAKRLYKEIGYRNITIVLTDWEQDHLYLAYPEYTIERIEQRQADVMRARREAFLELGYRPKLRVMHSVIVNQYPANGGKSGNMLAEQIPKLKHRPDLIGLSYWSKGTDPVETLDWLRSVTGYGRGRIYIDELGATEGQQAERFASYIPAYWEWGAPVVNVWLWKQTWCDGNMGLWEQSQPCAGKVTWGDPTDGYYVLQELNSGIN